MLTSESPPNMILACWWRGFWCWRGRNPGSSNAKRVMSIKGEMKGHFGEGKNFAGEKNKRSVASSNLRAWGKASALWFFWREEWQHLSFRSHHRHTRIIFGGDSEVSMLNFFLPTVYLPRLHMPFLLPRHLFFPLIWRLYCLGVDNKGHTWLLLIGYEWFRNFLTEFGIFY